MRANKIWVAVLLILLAVAALVSLVPKTVVAAGGPGDIRSWGLVEDPSGKPHNVLVLFDPSTGEIWGYPEHGLAGSPVYFGKLTKLGQPLTK